MQNFTYEKIQYTDAQDSLIYYFRFQFYVTDRTIADESVV